MNMRRRLIPDEMKAQFAALYCDRRFGIGADGVLYLSKSTTCNIRMRIFQPDESEAEMCGNGIRCLAKYAFDAGYVEETLTVETLPGTSVFGHGVPTRSLLRPSRMPTPKFERKDIPATGDGEYHERIGEFEVYAVNTGVPHAVILADSVDSVDIGAAAPPSGTINFSRRRKREFRREDW